ncbi:hypothetical protein C1N63_04575 [Pantoea ananatis]|uniref:hypothetical protein n=1 Tax=Pantoea ananas TaxID=553 RepID=UPI000B7EF195|nr:hypothetical protein [Pantoea ananatis]AWQ18157.1 hypothetical protein C1N63_04575 [Pantoea ananatis]MDS7720053.1 hypothetical protein [Pantoea ananatis]
MPFAHRPAGNCRRMPSRISSAWRKANIASLAFTRVAHNQISTCYFLTTAAHHPLFCGKLYETRSGDGRQLNGHVCSEKEHHYAVLTDILNSFKFFPAGTTTIRGLQTTV